MDQLGPSEPAPKPASDPTRTTPLRWALGELGTVWPPLAVSVGAQWANSGIQVAAATLVGWASMRVSGGGEGSLRLPTSIDAFVGIDDGAVPRALALALALTVLAGVLDVVVAWTLTWAHARLLPGITRAAAKSVLPQRGRHVVDASTCIQRWLLKTEVSRFLVGTLAQVLGAVGTVAIVIGAAWNATWIGGAVATVGLVVWSALALPVAVATLRATRKAALLHEALGREIRATGELGEVLWHLPLQRAWEDRLDSQVPRLNRAVVIEGAWGSLLYGGLTAIANTLPLVAALAVASTADVGTLVAVYLYLSRLTGPLGSLAAALPSTQNELVSIERVHGLFRPPESSVAGTPTDEATLSVRGLVVKVEQDRPGIRYPDFTGSGLVAVVGRSGSGKSTLLRVIAGLVVPGHGEVTFGGVNPDGSDAWRRACALMPQEPAPAPVGVPVSHSSCSPLTRLVRHLGVHDASDGDGGVLQRSVGERRALALVQTLSTHARLILLDEPTAGMDAALAGLAASALRDAADQGRTVVVATHQRDLSLLDADSIVSLDELEMSQRGTPA